MRDREKKHQECCSGIAAASQNIQPLPMANCLIELAAISIACQSGAVSAAQNFFAVGQGASVSFCGFSPNAHSDIFSGAQVPFRGLRCYNKVLDCVLTKNEVSYIEADVGRRDSLDVSIKSDEEVLLLNFNVVVTTAPTRGRSPMDNGDSVVTLDQNMDEAHSSPGLHAAAVPGLAEECATLGGCRAGMAKMTSAYDLPARKVIHSVGPKYAVKYLTAAENALSHCSSSCLEITSTLLSWDKHEEEMAILKLPADVRDENGETVIDECKIRIKPLPSAGMTVPHLPQYQRIFPPVMLGLRIMLLNLSNGGPSEGTLCDICDLHSSSILPAVENDKWILVVLNLVTSQFSFREHS
ncbi:hypothetical protein Nepgr_003616 [Nepenthes gracilis]|uniref:Macro domain-containing protein n=1 Tax=Nepenthes gracilis TaxID=150966 RepID=A0AAD3RZW9_NEPGR|nr:hypothetical protein Nepgr_003616 [Nepenthes gracilis]